MKKYRREAREKIIQHYHESGLSTLQYSRQHDLSEASLKRWIKEFREPGAGAEDKISFVEIQAAKPVVKPQAKELVPVLTIRYKELPRKPRPLAARMNWQNFKILDIF